jgi:hypothetical protein
MRKAITCMHHGIILGYQLKVDKMGEACSKRERKMRNTYKILVGKPEWKIPCGRPRRRWKDNIRRDLTEITWEGLYMMHVA